MSETTQATINEFGTVVQPGVTPGEANAKPATLDEILEAVRGIKVTETKSEATPPTADAAPDVKKEGDPVALADIDTGSKALDIAVRSFITSSNATQADIERATAKAIEYGDANLIDKAFLAERFGERASEAASIAEAVVEQAAAKREALVQSVYATAGGKEGWDKSLALYKEHAPQGLQKALQLMFDSGDSSTVNEAAKLVVEFANNSGLIVKGAGSRQVAGAGPQDAQGLTAVQFQQAVGKLNQSSRTYRDDYARLIEMRRIGKQLGK